MADEPRDPVGTVIDILTRAALDAGANLNHSDKIFVGSRLLAALVSSAKALSELDAMQPNTVIVDDYVRQAADALQEVGVALRSHVKYPRG